MYSLLLLFSPNGGTVPVFSRTSFSPQRMYVRLNLGVELNILKLFVIFNHRVLCPALSVLLEIWAV